MFSRLSFQNFLNGLCPRWTRPLEYVGNISNGASDLWPIAEGHILVISSLSLGAIKLIDAHPLFDTDAMRHGEQDQWHSKVKNKASRSPLTSVTPPPIHLTPATTDAPLAFSLKSSNYPAAGLCLLPALRGLQSAADTRRPQSTAYTTHTDIYWHNRHTRIALSNRPRRE